MLNKWLAGSLIAVLVVPNFSWGAYPPDNSSIIADSRRIDWTKAGVVGGIPSDNWSQCGPTVSAGSSASTIQSAINSCGTNQYVQLGAGTFNLNNGLIMKSNVVLRGMGAHQTLLVFTGDTSCAGAFASVCFAGGDSTDYFQDPKVQPGGRNAATWVGGFSKGSTQLTFSNIGSSGISQGKYIYLDQADDPSVNNGFFVCEDSGASPPCSVDGGAGDPGRVIGGNAYQQVQIVKVTAVNGNIVTIDPGLYAANWASGKNPGAWWPDTTIQNAGLENLSVDGTNGGQVNVHLYNAANVWVKGTRQIKACDCERRIIGIQQTTHATIQNNYIFGQSGHSVHYGVESFIASDCLIINNIFQHTPAPMLLHSNTGSVYAYNYAINNTYDDNSTSLPIYHYMANAIGGHSGGVMYNLFEGNIGPGMGADTFHGNQLVNTGFRNYWLGYELSRFDALIAVGLEAYSRYYNIVGNVLGSTVIMNSVPGASYKPALSYQGNDPSIYHLGNGRSNMSDDPLVATTLLRWGNYDVFTDAHDGTGNGVRWDAAEVPSGLSSYANPVPPSDHVLPPSLFLAGKPLWWPSGKVWPPIGPDVSGGIADVAGHAYRIPAEDCYYDVLHGPADGFGSPLSFNADACYSTTPPVPTAVSITSQPGNTILIEGQSANFSVMAGGYPYPTYQWQRMPVGGAWTNISGATSSSYSQTALLADSGMQFRCIATNNPGAGPVTATSNAATMTVNPAPPAKFKIGDRVVVSNMPVGDSAHIFNAAGGSQVGTQPLGALGNITAGPTDNGGSTWWSVNFDSGVDGWDVENYLELATPPTNNHPGDADQNMHMTLNEATQYGFCWKSAPLVPGGCPAGADLNRATRAGLLYGSTADGVYHFDSTMTAPACWVPGP